MIGQGELRTPHASRITPHASRLTHHTSRRAGTRTKTICPPFGGHNKIIYMFMLQGVWQIRSSSGNVFIIIYNKIIFVMVYELVEMQVLLLLNTHCVWCACIKWV